jgi:predicted amidohydrolase
MDAMRIAAANWELRQIARYEDFEEHLCAIVAAAGGADLVLLPENVTYELLHLCPGFPEELVPEAIAGHADAVLASLADAARRHGVRIVGCTSLVRTPAGIVNAWAYADPDGAFWGGAKNRLIQYEIAPQCLTPGNGLSLLPDSRFGVAVCYDIEFPECGRALAEAGALCFLVPANTEDRRGFHRVRRCALARAVENQVFVAHASLVGRLGAEPVPSTHGSSAVIAPSIEPFPADAVLDQSPFGVEGAAVADLDFEALLAARQAGEVRNWNDRNAGEWRVRRPGIETSHDPGR